MSASSDERARDTVLSSPCTPWPSWPGRPGSPVANASNGEETHRKRGGLNPADS